MIQMMQPENKGETKKSKKAEFSWGFPRNTGQIC